MKKENNAPNLLAERYKKVFFLKDEDIYNVKKAGEAIFKQKEIAFSEFYAWIESQPDLKRIFTDDLLAKIEKTEADTWVNLVEARVNEQSVLLQQGDAKLFRMYGVSFDEYLSILVGLHEVIENLFIRKNVGTVQMLRSFRKVTGIHICVVIDAYNEAINEALHAQNQAIMEMSTPVTKLWDGISFLPLVGIIDSRRSENIMTTMLHKIMETRSKVFILDISGIAILDTAVANYLIKMTKASKLMGCQCIVSGISPAVAQTIISLGVSEYEIQTEGSLQDALKKAYEITGITISKKTDSY